MSDVQSNSYVHHTLMNKQDKDINLSTSDSKDHDKIFTSSIQPHQINSSQNLNNNKTEADSQNPSEWDLLKTLQWMIQNNLSDLVDIIRDGKIHGQAFLDLNHKTLRSLNVDSYNDRKRLLRAIKTLMSDSDDNGLSVEIQKLDLDTPNSPVTPSSARNSHFPPESSQNAAHSPSEAKPSKFSPNTSTSTLASDSILDQNRNNKAGYNEQTNTSGPTLSEAFQTISNNRLSNYDSMDNESPTPKPPSYHPNIQVHNTPGSPDSDTNSSFTVLGPPRFKNSVYGSNSNACLSEPSLPMVISPESEVADPIHKTSFQLNSISFDSTAYKSNANPNSNRPIITPRKESMANLKNRAQNSPFATSPRILRNSPSSNLLQPTTLDAMLSSQRRSSLYYNAQRLSMIDSEPGPGKALEVVQTTPTLSSKPKLKTKASQESGILASIFPSIFKKTPKHSRKLSCPEDNPELENILVNLHDVDGTLHPLYLTPPVTPNHLYDTIAAKLHLDPSKSYQFKATTDSITTTVSSKRDIVALLYQSGNQTPLKLDLLPQNPEKPPLPKLQIFSAPIVPNQEKSSFSIATRNPQRPSSTKSPTNTTNAPISPNKPISPSTTKTLPSTAPEPAKKPNETPSWAQMWIERPSTDMISDNLDKYFPDQDLDKPILDPVPQPPSAPSVVSAIPQNVLKEGSLGRKKSIRMVVQEAHQRRTSSAKNLSRSNTKLWGSKLTRVNTKKEITNERPVSVIPESPTKTPESPSTVPSSMADFPLDLIEKQQNQGPPMQWVMGKIIGRGSFGRVFHALNAANGEMLAVKVIELPSAKSQSNISRKRGDMIRDLYSEIELLKDLEHENIVQYLGFELCPQSINIFLEYVDGGSIESALHRHGPFPEEHCKSLTRQVLKGLEYLHNKNILHRDIKGANVLINSQGVCKISDFGISKKNDYQIAYKNNARMSFKGSVFWMAPEVVRHNGYSAKVDIWSLGCLVIEMLTSHRPWKDLTELAAVYRLGQSTDASTPNLPDSSSELSREFMRQCFIIEPEHRPTAKQLLSHPFCK